MPSPESLCHTTCRLSVQLSSQRLENAPKPRSHPKVDSKKQHPVIREIRASLLIAYSRRQAVFSYSELNLEMSPFKARSLADCLISNGDSRAV